MNIRQSLPQEELAWRLFQLFPKEYAFSNTYRLAAAKLMTLHMSSFIHGQVELGRSKKEIAGLLHKHLFEEYELRLAKKHIFTLIDIVLL